MTAIFLAALQCEGFDRETQIKLARLAHRRKKESEREKSGREKKQRSITANKLKVIKLDMGTGVIDSNYAKLAN